MEQNMCQVNNHKQDTGRTLVISRIINENIGPIYLEEKHMYIWLWVVAAKI